MQKDIEKEIIERVQKGDADAFAEVYKTYAAHLYRFISFRVGNARDADDIHSEVFLKSYEAVVRGTRVTNMRAFLYKTTRNTIVDHFRKRAREEAHTTEISDEFAEKRSEVMSVLDARIELAKVKESMRSLKQDYQHVIQLRFIEEMEVEEIASILGKSRVATRVLLHRAMKALKKKLSVSP